MATLCPASKMQSTLIEDLEVAGREKVRCQDHKRVRPNQETMLNTPPTVIGEMTLVCVSVCVCGGGGGGGGEG